MRFALVHNERVEASPDLKGLCPGCGQDVIAKCGTQRIWHWAHRGKRTCDPWWETETEWHRAWKDKFPSEWQECRQRDQSSGEWHIADVRTDHGFVIEFQHSPIKLQERAARQQFYMNMVWVVNGTRLEGDYSRFLEGQRHHWHKIKTGLFLVAYPKKSFPAAWLASSVPVFFDFQGIVPADPQDKTRFLLWCLLPGRGEEIVSVVALSREDFVLMASNGDQLFRFLRQACETASTFLRSIPQRRRAAIEAERNFLRSQMLRRQSWRSRRRRRRF